jgi:predicted nuclease with RNAse H fold
MQATPALKLDPQGGEWHVPSRATVVVGIDVGGPRKGFHAVALREGSYLDTFASRDARDLAAWCIQVGARAVAIDAPCRWSRTGRARPAERALAAEGIHAFATPSLEAAEGRAFYRWMHNGAALYEVIEPHFPLFNGGNAASGPICCETFPQAVACALAGKVVSARHKTTVRRELLREAGIATQPLSNIDVVDAALCALAAQALLAGRFQTYGDAGEGFIVVPAWATTPTAGADPVEATAAGSVAR